MKKMMSKEDGSWFSFGTLLGLMALISSVLPSDLRISASHVIRLIISHFSQYVQYTIPEFDGANMNELYLAIELYLSTPAAKLAKKINLTLPKNSSSLVFGLDEYTESIPDFSFKPGSFKAWWLFRSHEPSKPSFSWREEVPDVRRYLILSIKKKDREVLNSYMDHIMARAKEMKIAQRDRKIFTNLKDRDYGYFNRGKVWESVSFKHPATFDTLAMDPVLKEKIKEDLRDFATGEDFYNRVGRAWKRGYLLYGPPGTGKSSMIAAMANFLQYDVYDLELTQVKSNVHLKDLLIKTSNRSIIVIEDIDCSLDLTANRTKKKKKNDADKDKAKRPTDSSKSDSGNELTLSGLLNFTDGLWSCCGSERLFVFTTNHIEKLDPALLRSGCMDMHIHLSYCGFQAFRVLTKNYLGVEEHEMFDEIRAAMDEEGVAMTPAEISEVLTREKRDVDGAMRFLVKELKESKAKRAMEKLELLKEMEEDNEEDPAEKPKET